MRRTGPGENQDGLLSVDCWCGRRMLWVKPEVVRACLTESCGLPWCRKDGSLDPLCLHCGGEIPLPLRPGRQLRQKRYCSQTCRGRAERARRDAREQAAADALARLTELRDSTSPSPHQGAA